VLLAWLTRPAKQPDEDICYPHLDVLIAAYNEEASIEAKLINTRALAYPSDRLTITVITDGSTDRTPDLVREHAGASVRLLHRPERQGKAAALARALPYLHGEALLFTDANCSLAPDAARLLVRHLSDLRVGAVSGIKRIRGTESGAERESLYWRYEGWLKDLDGRFGSVMGAPGEIWLARRQAYRPPPEDIILEDLYTSMDIVARGWRMCYEPGAVSSEEAAPSLQAEWERRSRNAAGGLQCIFRLRQVWHGGARTVFQFLSHRVLRWTMAPAAFALLPVWTAWLLPSPLYLAFLLLEGAFALAALAGYVLARNGRSTGWLALPLQVALLNGAALAGAARLIRGRQTVLWAKVRD